MDSKLVVIVGLGALGSQVATFARNWEVRFRLVDFDLVEQKNVLSQAHSRLSLRKNKALSLQQSLLGMHGLKVEARPYRLVPENVNEILSGATLVLDCTDNLAARELIGSYAARTGTPTLHGALSASGDFARVVWTEHFLADSEGESGEATCEDGENLPFFALSAALLASEAQRFLRTGRKASFQLTPTAILRLR